MCTYEKKRGILWRFRKIIVSLHTKKVPILKTDEIRKHIQGKRPDSVEGAGLWQRVGLSGAEVVDAVPEIPRRPSFKCVHGGRRIRRLLTK